MSKKITCAIINLETKTIEQKEFEPKEALGKWAGVGIHQGLLAEVWEKAPETVALTTGPLTGVGLPGSGFLAWCSKQGNVLQAEIAEGRLGAALRLGGIDHLLFVGAGKNENLYIADGEITFLDQPDTKRNSDLVTASVTVDGVCEDQYFKIGSKALAQQLINKGIASIQIVSHREIEIADSKKFLDYTIGLYQECKKADRNDPENELPVPYLSVCNIGEVELSANCAALNAILGVAWNEVFPKQGQSACGAELLSILTGTAYSQEALEKAGAKLKECSLAMVQEGRGQV